MADVLPASPRTLLTAPRAIPHPIDTRQPAPVSASHSTTLPNITPGVRSGHLNLDTFSPVNQNGSFAFDRVLKSGDVHKRTRKTKVSSYPSILLRHIPLSNAPAPSNGNPSTLFSVPTFSHYTSLLPRSVSSNKSALTTSTPSATSKTQKAAGNTSSASSPPNAATTSKQKATQMQKHGWN